MKGVISILQRRSFGKISTSISLKSENTDDGTWILAQVCLISKFVLCVLCCLKFKELTKYIFRKNFHLSVLRMLWSGELVNRAPFCSPGSAPMCPAQVCRPVQRRRRSTGFQKDKAALLLQIQVLNKPLDRSGMFPHGCESVLL